MMYICITYVSTLCIYVLYIVHNRWAPPGWFGMAQWQYAYCCGHKMEVDKSLLMRLERTVNVHFLYYSQVISHSYGKSLFFLVGISPISMVHVPT